MLASTYDHRVLRLMGVDKIRKEVQTAFLNDEIYRDAEYPGIIFITSKCSDVPVFSHPIKVHDSIAIDVRTITKLDTDERLIVRSQDEFQFLLLRAKLELVWTNEEKQPNFTTVAAVPSKFFSSYIADTLTRMHTLGPDKASVVHVVAAVYFWCQFRPHIEDLSEHEATLLKYVKNATGLPHEYILPILSDMFSVQSYGITTLETFIELLNNLPSLENSLHGLTVRTLNTTTMYAWRGGHSNETVSLSLEYPPCFIAMLVAANGYRAFKHTPLEQLISRHRKVDVDAYARSVKALTQD